MAYVRAKGNQVVIVHGERDPETKKVQQRVLFTLYSKREAEAAIGPKEFWFRGLLEEESPTIRFNWKAIMGGIRENMEVLPDIYGYEKDRGEQQFRGSLVAFAKELLIADPQSLLSSARLIERHRHELEWLQDLIHWRLKATEQKGSPFNQDDPFHWRTMRNRRDVPPDCRERLSGHYERGEHEKAEALARLLIEAWPNFARGYNYLGLIARDRGDLPQALEFFETAKEVGRSLFPKRIRKDSYWVDLDTRPYIRALCHLVQTHNRLGNHEEALALCDHLNDECARDITAADLRVPVFLNAGLWEAATYSARHVLDTYPTIHFPLALALHEQGDERDALVSFLQGAIQFPRAARLLVGLKADEPIGMMEAKDWDHGQHLRLDLEGYLKGHRKTLRHFREVLKHPEVVAVLEEAEDVRKAWHADRSGERIWFDKMHEMQSAGFVKTLAEKIQPDAAEKRP